MASCTETNTKHFVIIKGLDSSDFIQYVDQLKELYRQDKRLLFIIGSTNILDIELFCEKEQKTYKGANALYKIIITDYEEPDNPYVN